jgi:citrate lyase subunit beta / citryl-CoA lyase
VHQIVRVNEVSAHFFAADLEMAVQSQAEGIMLPKTESAEQVQIVDKQLAVLERKHGLRAGQVSLFPLIETSLGVVNSLEVARASRRIRRFAFGAVDYTADIRTAMSDDGLEIVYAQSQLVNTSAAAGIAGPIDTAHPDFGNEELLKAHTRRAKKLGFQGKMVIHPRQIDVVNDIFTPGEEEVRQAESIVNAYEQALREGSGVVQLNGKMIDVPVVKNARQILSLKRNLD